MYIFLDDDENGACVCSRRSLKLMVVCLCVCVRALWSDTSPVAVERRYVEHVAVSANSHWFHLTVSRQRGGE